MKKRVIYPSLLAFEQGSVEAVLSELDGMCTGYHIDIMDGAFVPHVAGGVGFANYVSAKSSTPHQWVHLMVEDPLMILKDLTLKEGSIASVHIESNYFNSDIINFITEKNMVPSLAISPKTAWQRTIPFLDKIGQVLVMSVEPGASGQPFVSDSLEKIQALAQYRAAHALDVRIGVDGGVNEKNIKELALLGVDDFAISSGIFSNPDPVQALSRLQALIV